MCVQRAVIDQLTKTESARKGERESWSEWVWKTNEMIELI